MDIWIVFLLSIFYLLSVMNNAPMDIVVQLFEHLVSVLRARTWKYGNSSFSH